MKLLFCQACGDLVAPNPTARELRRCRCQRHTVWWENPFTGVLRIHDAQSSWFSYENHPEIRRRAPSPAPAAYVIGLHNGLLSYEHRHDSESIRCLIEATPDSYIFKTLRSLVIRIRPGESNDTAYAEELPGVEATA
jgi:hypothetical protein